LQKIVCQKSQLHFFAEIRWRKIATTFFCRKLFAKNRNYIFLQKIVGEKSQLHGRAVRHSHAAGLQGRLNPRVDVMTTNFGEKNGAFLKKQWPDP
jgi:hypothetical protein